MCDIPEATEEMFQRARRETKIPVNYQRIIDDAREQIEMLRIKREQIDKEIEFQIARSFKWQRRILQIEREE